VVPARARAGTAACLAFGAVLARVHGRYGRRLAGAAIGGLRVVVRLAVRECVSLDRPPPAQGRWGLASAVAKECPQGAGVFVADFPRDR
jgi:hypothetical protein